MKLFRLLKADEIEVRIQSVKNNGCIVLLYKDARCDMNILDETFGAENWQRKHELINGNLFCNVGIRFNDNWIWKQDVGVESNTEKEKGQASDSFKRACFNWGIGRELYSSPFIWIKLADNEISQGKCYAKFFVKEIEYNEKEEISKLIIVDEKGVQRYSMNPNIKMQQAIQEPKQPTQKQTLTPPTTKNESQKDYRDLLIRKLHALGIDMAIYAKEHGLNAKSTQEEFKKACEELDKGVIK